MPRNSIFDFSVREMKLIYGEIVDENVDVEALRREYKETEDKCNKELLSLFTPTKKKPLTQEQIERINKLLDEYEDYEDDDTY